MAERYATRDPSDGFEDLLAANRSFAEDFALEGLPGVAGAGVVILTCMDSRIDPLRILGLSVGDAKVVRNPGGRLTDETLEALVLAVNLLGADKVMVVPHTRCAMASSTEQQMHERIGSATSQDASWLPIHVVPDQVAALEADVRRLRAHPLVPDTVSVGGFRYDVDTGLIEQLA